jgi:hypothetical protein
MKIAILQFDLHIHAAQSLKDKRRVVKGLKDRLHREHMVSVAEVGLLDTPSVARLGLAAVGNDVAILQSLTDRILDKLRTMHEAELGPFSREILHGDCAGDATDEAGNPLWDDSDRRDAPPPLGTPTLSSREARS